MGNKTRRLEEFTFERVSAPTSGRIPREMYVHRFPGATIGRSLRCNFPEGSLDNVSAELVIDRIVSSFNAMDHQDKEGLERLIYVLKGGLQHAEAFLAQIEREEAQAARDQANQRKEAFQRLRLTLLDPDDMSDAEVLGAAEALVAALREA